MVQIGISMITNPILQFISDLRRNGKIPEVFPEALAEAITFTGNLNVAHGSQRLSNSTPYGGFTKQFGFS